jgi:hypothetical protein
MQRIKSTLRLFTLIMIATTLIRCEKPAGPGGRATVKGRVFAFDFDNTQRYMVSKQYQPGEKVYIVYGSQSVVGNNVTTSTDGSFEFLYLNKGHYKVFVNSLDTSIKVKGNNTKIPVIKEFDITDNRQTIDLGDLIINK